MLDENSQNYLYFFGIRKPTNIYIYFLLDYVLPASILNIFLMDIFSFKSIVNFDEFFIKHKNLIFGE